MRGHRVAKRRVKLLQLKLHVSFYGYNLVEVLIGNARDIRFNHKPTKEKKGEEKEEKESERNRKHMLCRIEFDVLFWIATSNIRIWRGDAGPTIIIVHILFFFPTRSFFATRSNCGATILIDREMEVKKNKHWMGEQFIWAVSIDIKN